VSELANTIERLAQRYREPWYVVKELHKYPDGTTSIPHGRVTVTLSPEVANCATVPTFRMCSWPVLAERQGG
jgi:hypothetical protein